MSVITICGSFMFTDTMWKMYQELTEMGHVVLLPAIGCNTHDKEWYLNLHYKKIAMSDVVFIVDVNGYIGESTRKEEREAEKCGKKIVYYSSKWSQNLQTL